MIIAFMSQEAITIVERLYEVLAVGDVVAGLADESVSARVRATLMEVAEPDFEVRFRVPAELGGPAFEGRGPDGFREAWEQWTEPFQAFRIELEERIEAGDDIVDLVNLTATSKTGGVEVQHAGAAVWTVRNGKLAKTVFYLERRDALEAAGLDPNQHSG
jgi:ketosteroid isomerase-like protein